MKHKLLRKFFLSVGVLMMVAASVHAQSRSVLGKIVTVSVNQAWTSTNIYINAGDSYLIKVTGIYEVGGSSWPPGMNDYKYPNGYGAGGGAYPDINVHSVVARIGDGEPFYIGNMRDFTADESGELSLGINDDHFGDNSGHLTSQVWALSSTLVAVEDEASMTIPVQVSMSQNYPNPFNPSTSISYRLEREGHVNLKIFNSLGQQVATLVDKYQEAGPYSVIWDSRDHHGQQVASGTYFYRLQVNGRSVSKKAVLLK
jgi:hypothetical protein